MKKINKKGFTLIELLAAIFIISLIAGIGSYSVVKVINNSREKGKEVSLSNVFKTCQLYVKEHFNSVSWIADDDNTKEYTCVSIQSLVNDGFFDKKVFNIDGINDSTLVKVTRNKTTYVYDSVNSSSISNDSNIQCNSHFINPPKCNSLTYNGESQQLISDIGGNEDKYTLKLNSVSVDSIESVSGIDANSYSINATISNTEGNQYSWANYSNSSINLTCKINKKKVFIQGNGSYTFNPNDFDGNTLKSDYKDSIISDLNNKSKGLVEGHTINDINISKSSNGRKLNYSGAQVYNNETNVSSNYNIEYNSSNLIINRGVDKPTSICKSGLIYNGSPQILADAGEGYTLSGNVGTDADSYTVSAVLDNGLSWSDGSKDVLSYNCSIGKANLVLTIDSPINTYEHNFRLENYPHDYVTLTSPQFSNQIFDLDDIYIEYYYSQSSDCSNLDIQYSDTSNNITGSSKFYAKGKISKYDDNFNDNIWSNCAEVNKLTPPDDSYVLHFELNNSSSWDDREIKLNDVFNVSYPSKTGYSFKGWNAKSGLHGDTAMYGDTSSNVSTFWKIGENWTKDVKAKYFKSLRRNSGTSTISAAWEPIEYNVTFQTAVDSCKLSKTTDSWIYDGVYEVTNPTCTGYTFAGWNRVSGINSTTAKYGTSSTKVNTLWYQNNTWKTDVKGKSSTFFKNLKASSSDSSIMKAAWTKNGYNISYTLNGGTEGTNAPTSAKYDSEFSVSNPTRTGYTFKGWKISNMDNVRHYYKLNSSETTWSYTSSDTISSTKYSRFKNLRSTSGTVKFEAMWTPKTYSVSYNPNPPTPDSGIKATLAARNPAITTWNNTTVNYDQQFYVEHPTKTGYSFNGWNISNMDSVTHYYGTNSSTKTSLSNIQNKYFKNLRSTSETVKFVAQWTANKYKLTYNNNSGSGCTYTTSTYNSTWGKLCTPSRSGYLFVGWYTTASGGTQVTSSTKVTGNKTVYAHWRPKISIRSKTSTDSSVNLSRLHDICPSDDAKSPSRKACEDNPGAYNTVYVTAVSFNSSTNIVTYKFKLHMNRSYATWEGSGCDGRIACIAKMDSDVCLNSGNSFSIADGWLSPNSTSSEYTGTINVSNLSDGNYRLIIKHSKSSCTSKRYVFVDGNEKGDRWNPSIFTVG